jgi:hypothetical protein
MRPHAAFWPPLTGLPVKGGWGDLAVSDKTFGNRYNPNMRGIRRV